MFGQKIRLASPWLLIALGSQLAGAPPYQLRSVVQVGDVISGETVTGLFPPSLNNNGAIVFLAYTNSTSGGGLFTQGRKLVSFGQIVAGLQLLQLSLPAVNDRGEIVFAADDLNTSGVVSTSLGAQTPSLLLQQGQSITGLTLTTIPPGMPFRSVSINNLGSIAFFAFFQGSAGGFTPGIFSISKALCTEGSVISGKTITGLLSETAMSNNGVVVFGPAWSGGGGIATPNSILAQPGEIISGLVIDPLNINFAVNSLGQPAFVASYPGGYGVFTPSAVIAKTGDAIGGEVLNGQPEYVAFNSTGTAAFIDSFAGGSGVFTQNGLVVKTGDTIGSKTLTDVSGTVINNSGDIAFLASFSDGTAAIVLATIPSSVSISPRSETFGPQIVGTVSAPKLVTITNTSSSAESLAGFQVAGQFMQQNDCPPSLNAGASCTLSVSFAPTTPGPKSGQVVFSAQGNATPRVITLAGMAKP